MGPRIVWAGLLIGGLSHRSRNEPAAAVGLALTIGLQLAVICAPGSNEIFRTAPLDAQELALCFALASVVFVAVETERPGLESGGTDLPESSGSVRH